MGVRASKLRPGKVRRKNDALRMASTGSLERFNTSTVGLPRRHQRRRRKRRGWSIAHVCNLNGTSEGTCVRLLLAPQALDVFAVPPRRVRHPRCNPVSKILVILVFAWSSRLDRGRLSSQGALCSARILDGALRCSRMRRDRRSYLLTPCFEVGREEAEASQVDREPRE